MAFKSAKQRKYVMSKRKVIWDRLDELEGKKIGSSYSNLQDERVRQGYRKKKNGN